MSHIKVTGLQRNMMIAVLLAAAFVSLLNQTLLLIAIPSIMHEFSIDASMGQWLTTVYMLTNGIFIPITAYLIGRFTNRQLLIGALTIFGAGTILGAFAGSFSVLLVARILQAIGAGMIMPLMQTILITIFPPEKRGSAMGMAGLVTGFAPAIGPTLSGWLIGSYSWRSIFYVVIPVTIIVLLVAIAVMRNLTEQKRSPFHVPSLITSTLGWGGLLYGFSMVGSYGLSNPLVYGSLIVGAIGVWLFITTQLKLEKPMLNFRVFQSKTFTISTILSVLAFAIMVSTQVLLTFYVQNVRAISAIHAGLVLLPGALVMGFMSPVTGKIFDKYGSKGLSYVGFTSITIATIAFGFVSMQSSLYYVAFLFALQCFGICMIMMPLTTAGMNTLQLSLMAHGTAMNGTFRMVGSSIMTALLVSIMSIATNNHSSQDVAVSMLHGIQIAFHVSTALSIIGLILSVIMKHEKKGATKQALSKA